MKCLNCGQENKDTAKNCKKCGRDVTLAPAWFPDWRWHVRTLSIIYASLIVVFFIAKFALRKLPPPYNIREIPAEMTPWLKHKIPSDTDAGKASGPLERPYEKFPPGKTEAPKK